MMQPSHQDPALRIARAVLSEVRPQHQLWWQPGIAGRGFVQPNGVVHTWPESEGTHSQMANAKGIPWTDIECASMLIRPDGTAVFPYARQLGDDYEAKQMQAVQQATNRLRPISYDPNKGIAQAYGNVWRWK